MPLRKEMRKYYGPRHRAARREAILAAGGPFCSLCHASHPMVNLAHLSHDPRDSGSRTLLCPSCHGIHDTPHRIAVTRRTRARRAGQLWLDPEIEYAAFPTSLWPLRLRQLSLF